MAVVLWGGRRGDVQFGSRAWRRSRIPIGAETIDLASSAWFDVGTTMMAPAVPGSPVFRVIGVEGNTVGVERV